MSILARSREINWGIIFAVLFSLIIWSLLLMPLRAHAQTAASVVTVEMEPMRPRAAVRELYDSVVACAGELAVPTQTFEKIRFFVRDTMESNGGLILGQWNADSIFITRGFERDGWVIAHEMLHHVLNGPPKGNPHPLTPFEYPCGLYEHPEMDAIQAAWEELHPPLTDSNFSYPVMGYAVYSQGTILAGHGWHR